MTLNHYFDDLSSKTELKNWFKCLFLAWMSENEEKKVTITYYFKLNQQQFINF